MHAPVDSGYVREFHPGMGQAVAERTILRKDESGRWETWKDVAHRVALGNALLQPPVTTGVGGNEYGLLRKHIAKGSILMSGRHLQHGDVSQPRRTKEVFTNCSTSAASFLSFYLLLAGSGVGRCYDDELMLVDWDCAPTLRVVLSHEHPDFDWSAHESVRDALHKYGPNSKNVMWFEVPDSREGWAQALEILETGAHDKVHKDKMLVLDFSKVRPKGQPIGGMQGRPASGPVSLMNAFMKAASLKGSGLPLWKQAMYVDHYFSECVLVGGARRAARMSTKSWRDPGVIDFIRIKRPIEFDGLSPEEVVAKRREKQLDSFLWSSNNSVTVDKEFWLLLELPRKSKDFMKPLARHARRVWKEIVNCSYADGTGEPATINVDKLVRDDTGWTELAKGSWAGSRTFQVRDETEVMLARLARRALKMRHNMIVNPCGEIVLCVLGGFCVIADVVPFHCDSLEEVEEAFRVATRALIRVNTMDSIYHKESMRTNRIGVGITGVHEFAWKFFQVGFRDLIDPDMEAAAEMWYQPRGTMNARTRAAWFWKTLEQNAKAVEDEAERYSKKLGVVMPHTLRTIKPSGTVSKLFGLTEGWHLPAMRYYMRWVQFRSDDPLVAKYEKLGYPVRKLRVYEGTHIVGFPTAPVISELGMGDELVTAQEATLEEHYAWLKLGEKYWIGEDRGNQISYTIKYDPKKVTLQEYGRLLKEHQQHVKCCSVLPLDENSYEYLPEEAVTREQYDVAVKRIQSAAVEDYLTMLRGKEHIDFAHVDCENGACPIDFKSREEAGAYVPT